MEDAVVLCMHVGRPAAHRALRCVLAYREWSGGEIFRDGGRCVGETGSLISDAASSILDIEYMVEKLYGHYETYLLINFAL